MLDNLGNLMRARQARAAAAGLHQPPVLVREDEAGARQADLGENGIVLGSKGDLVVEENTFAFTAPWPLVILEILWELGTAPVGASAILDFNRNGTTMYTTQANRPTVPAGNTKPSGTVVLPDVTNLAKGDRCRIDTDQVGSTTAGADPTLTIRWRRA